MMFRMFKSSRQLFTHIHVPERARRAIGDYMGFTFITTAGGAVLGTCFGGALGVSIVVCNGFYLFGAPEYLPYKAKEASTSAGKLAAHVEESVVNSVMLIITSTIGGGVFGAALGSAPVSVPLVYGIGKISELLDEKKPEESKDESDSNANINP